MFFKVALSDPAESKQNWFWSDTDLCEITRCKSSVWNTVANLTQLCVRIGTCSTVGWEMSASKLSSHSLTVRSQCWPNVWTLTYD